VASDSKITRKALKTYSDLLLEQMNTRSLSGISNEKKSRYEQPESSEQFAKSSFPDGALYLDLKLTPEDIAEGLARDVVRRIQQMRKEMDLKVDSYIEANLVVPQKIEKLLKTQQHYLAHEVRAKRLTISAEKKDFPEGFSKTWEINKENYEFTLRELSSTKRKQARNK
jgi:isoleucyl-tRNA synthetase